MNQQTIPNITLFDLLARNWQRTSAVRHLCFNDDDTLLAAVCDDGSLVIARLADNEPPEARIRVDGELGQATIHPREGKPSPLIVTRLKGSCSVSAFRDGGLLAANGKGDLVRVSRAGEIAETIFTAGEPAFAFDHCRTTGLTAIAAAGRLDLLPAGPGPIAETGLGWPTAECVAISTDGSLVAVAGPDRLNLRRSGDCLSSFMEIPLPSRPVALKFGFGDRWLGCGLSSGGLCLIETSTGRQTILSDFPGPVRALDWSGPANALVASGAYRIAGWSMDAPPFSSSADGALATGHPGMVMVEAVAAHPGNRLVAAGYANGQVVVAQIGSPEELIVRQAGGPVTALRWTADGRHLAMGDALGNLAIITFPKQLFK